MTHEYFYGSESEQFSFYRIPKILFTDDRFKAISAEAKILYGLLLDRMSLSVKNGWLDADGRVYIIYTVEDIMDALGCATQKAIKLCAELEKKAGLIEKKRQGLGKPNLIYVKNFIPSQNKSCENHNSGAVEIEKQELRESKCSNTNRSNTENNDTDSFLFASLQGDQNREPPPVPHKPTPLHRDVWRSILIDHIEFYRLQEDYPLRRDLLTEILELLVDTVSSTRETVRISGDDKPIEVVRQQFMRLESNHIAFVLDALHENTTRIRNMRQYLLATLYNAPLTIDNYYRSLVSHDMAAGHI